METNPSSRDWAQFYRWTVHRLWRWEPVSASWLCRPYVHSYLHPFWFPFWFRSLKFSFCFLHNILQQLPHRFGTIQTKNQDSFWIQSWANEILCKSTFSIFRVIISFMCHVSIVIELIFSIWFSSDLTILYSGRRLHSPTCSRMLSSSSVFVSNESHLSWDVSLGTLQTSPWKVVHLPTQMGIFLSFHSLDVRFRLPILILEEVWCGGEGPACTNQVAPIS